MEGKQVRGRDHNSSLELCCLRAIKAGGSCVHGSGTQKVEKWRLGSIRQPRGTEGGSMGC